VEQLERTFLQRCFFRKKAFFLFCFFSSQISDAIISAKLERNLDTLPIAFFPDETKVNVAKCGIM
jgi:hypothetical protein